MKHTFMFAITAIILLTAVSAFGQDKTYTGPTGGNWHNPANWTPPGIPNFADNVHVEEGSNVDAGGLAIEARTLYNEGQIDNPGDINVPNEFMNNGIINNAGDINVGQFNNWEDGEINGVVNIVAANDFVNIGLIQGQEGENLNIEINRNCSDSAWAKNFADGQILAQGENAGVIIVVRVVDFVNEAEINAPGAVKICAGGINNAATGQINGKQIGFHVGGNQFTNSGNITSSGGTHPEGMGDKIEISVFNPVGNGTFVNTGTIQGGDGDPGQGGDHIYISADIFRNFGLISSGLNGTGAMYGGYVTIKAKQPVFVNTESSGQIVSPSAGADQGVCVVCDNAEIPSAGSSCFRTTTDPLFRTNYLYILGRSLTFGNLPLSNIFATDYMEIFALNGTGNVLDFSDVTAGPIFAGDAGASINIRGDNLIAPPIGYNAMCDPDPTVSSGSISNTDVSVIGETVMSFPGHTGTFDVMIRNEHANPRSFNYTVTSVLGWFAPISGTTPELDPWETFSLTVSFTVPSGLSVTTVDTVTSSAYVMPMWERHKSNIIAFPFDTLTYLDVAESRAEVPEAMTISAYPNPFNSAVRIVVDCHSRESGNPEGVAVEIFDLNGRRVACLGPSTGSGHRSARQPDGTVGEALVASRNVDSGVSEREGTSHSPTTREFTWTPDESLPSGVYLVRARIENGNSNTKRIVLLK